MPGLAESRDELVAALLGHYGPLPKPCKANESEGDRDPFESIIRVAIAVVADPRTTDAALQALRRAGLLEARALSQASRAEVEDVLNAGRVSLPARLLIPLRKLAGWASDGGIEGLGPNDGPTTEALRETWRAIGGIGSVTTDALLLFAIGRATYPVDRATYRILVRHGWLDPSAGYDEARSVAEGLAPEDAAGLAEIAPAMARLGLDYCKAGRPRCERCPLRDWLPDDGPRAED